MRRPEDATRFGIVIFDGVEPIDLGAAVGVASMARRFLPGLAYTVIAERAGPVTLAGGLVALADHGFADAPAADALIVCGGPGWSEAAANPAMLAFLRLAPAGRLVSLCTGALILAAAGALDGLRATTRRNAAPGESITPLARLAEAGATPLSAQVVEDGGVLTSGGVSLAIDGALALIGRFWGETAMHGVARLIEYDRAFAANRAALGAWPG